VRGLPVGACRQWALSSKTRVSTHPVVEAACLLMAARGSVSGKQSSQCVFGCVCVRAEVCTKTLLYGIQCEGVSTALT